MSENPEVTAAATGAAAAVAAVQDEQRQEQIAEEAANAAVMASAEATGAHDVATVAMEEASTAVDTAASARSTAEAVAYSLNDVYARIEQQDAKQDEFITEARGFFAKLAEQQEPREPEVQKVEVTHHAPSPDRNKDNPPADTGQKQADTGSGSGTSQAGNSGRRHRFGR